MLPKNTAALMHLAMRQELAKQNRIISAALTGQRSGLLPRANEDGSVRMTETRIYVGLNDASTRRQEQETEKYLDTMKEICRSCHAAFSVDIEEGGYYHEDGEYTEETSLVLVLIDADRDVVTKIAKMLRAAFHQESVLVTENVIQGRLIMDD